MNRLQLVRIWLNRSALTGLVVPGKMFFIFHKNYLFLNLVTKGGRHSSPAESNIQAGSPAAFMMNIYTTAILVLILNFPFGFWRAGTKKFSLRWFLAIHVPVPFVIALRFMLGLGWHPVTFPVLVSAFFAGQFMGGRLYMSWKNRPTPK
jgi:hypothetical protein